MIKKRRELYRKFTRLAATFLMLALGWVPLRLGFWVRQWGYPFILKAMGKSVRISTGVEFLNPDLISLGNDVLLDRDVRLRPMGEQTTVILGNGVQVDRGTDLKVHYASKGCITIGDNTIIGPYCFLSGESIQIGTQCLIAPQVGIFANNHEFSDPLRYIRQQGHSYKGIVIDDDCWIGTGAKILDGVHIGKGCVIGAGAVVSKSLPPYSIAVGIPAKIVGSRKQGELQGDSSVEAAVNALIRT
ncbi:MAG: acyltransferase [Cyanobacteria bacterium P01_F01_bin.150]